MTTVKGLWYKEKFDDTKGVTRNRKSKDKRYNGQLDKTTTSLKQDWIQVLLLLTEI